MTDYRPGDVVIDNHGNRYFVIGGGILNAPIELVRPDGRVEQVDAVEAHTGPLRHVSLTAPAGGSMSSTTADTLIAAVADRLHDCVGLAVKDWQTYDDEHASAVITLDPLADHTHPVLVWHEEDGWAHGWTDPTRPHHGIQALTSLAGLPSDASPDDVAAAVFGVYRSGSVTFAGRTVALRMLDPEPVTGIPGQRQWVGDIDKDDVIYADGWVVLTLPGGKVVEGDGLVQPMTSLGRRFSLHITILD